LDGSIIGKFLIIAGVVLVVAGLVMTFSKALPVGKLPGDIHIQKNNFSFYFPITTSIIISVIITLVLFFLGKK